MTNQIHYFSFPLLWYFKNNTTLSCIEKLLSYGISIIITIIITVIVMIVIITISNKEKGEGEERDRERG